MKSSRILYANKKVGINDLTNDTLVIISNYLPKTSRALFAVALTAPSSSWKRCNWKGTMPNASSKAIISSALDELPITESLVDGLVQEFVEEMNCEDAPVFSSNNHRPILRYEYSYYHMDQDGKSKLIQFAKEGIDAQMREYYAGGWEVLDFVDIPKLLASRLTDEDLGAILKCIDGKNNLKRLNATHCNISGYGLEPLRGSKVLEKLDLGLTRQFEVPRETWNKLSDEAVCYILEDILTTEGNSFKRLQVPRAWRKRPVNERLSQFLDSHSAFLHEHSGCAYFSYIDKKNFFQQFDYDMEGDDADKCADCHSWDSFFFCDTCNEVQCEGCGWNKYECSCCDVTNCEDCWDSSNDNAVVICSDENGYNNEWCRAMCGECRLRECCDGYNCNSCKLMVFDLLVEERNKKQAEVERLCHELSLLKGDKEMI